MNKLDATMIYWSIRSAQHVSGSILSIIRSVRLRFYSIWYPVDVVGRETVSCSVALVPRCRSSWHDTDGKYKLLEQNPIPLLLCPQAIIWTRLVSILELHDEMLTSNRMRNAVVNYPKVFNGIEKFTLGNCSYHDKTYHCFNPVDCYFSALEVVVRKEYSTFSCKSRVEFLKAITWIGRL